MFFRALKSSFSLSNILKYSMSSNKRPTSPSNSSALLIEESSTSTSKKLKVLKDKECTSNSSETSDSLSPSHKDIITLSTNSELKSKDNQLNTPSLEQASLSKPALSSSSDCHTPSASSDNLHMNLRPRILRLNEDAKLPTRGSARAAGHDVYSSVKTVIPARGRKLVDTGISVWAPTGTYLRVAPRSGLAVKYGIEAGAGVVDEDYRGEVKVLLHNHSDIDFVVNKGDRIAQFILEKIDTSPFEEVTSLPSTERGSNGFGSTGKN